MTEEGTMTPNHLREQAESYLEKLCVAIDSRRVGSAGNRAATDFFASIISTFGFETEAPPFDCLDWRQEGVTLTADGTSFSALASPYSLGCQVSASLVVVPTLEALETEQISNKIVLLREEMTKEQLMPKNFPFYNPDHHQRIIQLLETKQPKAIIAATARDPNMVGGAIYPFPLIEDGDFDIPSAYMTDEEGQRLAEYAGQEIFLEIRARRTPATGCNIIARKGADPHHRVVVLAHIDAKMGTPGASDNASGIIVMLLLAELLADYTGQLELEIVAMNGEDYFSAPGEKQYLALNAGRFEEIMLGINVDGVGYYKGRAAYSWYDCPVEMADLIHKVFSDYEAGLVAGEPWYQGDHGLFLLHRRPALALTSDHQVELMAEITHTPQDRPEIIDCAKLVTIALALHDLVLQLGQHLR
jgi:aminopeptidase YwaD